MPKTLKGVPDLYIMHRSTSWWIEIKPRYANYMRDQMSTHQWQWFHDRYRYWNNSVRYAIVEDDKQLLDWVTGEYHGDPVWIEAYHWDRYDKWRREQ
jgi:hypothetical protein